MLKGHRFALVGVCRFPIGVCGGLAFAVGTDGLAWGDPHPMVLGASAHPQVSVEIRLRAETLRIHVLPDRAEVTADLDLENAGPARTLDVDIPCEHGEPAGTLAQDCRTPLAVTANSRRIANRQKNTANGPEYAWTMSFAPAEKKQLRVQYTTRLSNDRYKPPAAGALLLLYRLRTGADWAGKQDARYSSLWGPPAVTLISVRRQLPTRWAPRLPPLHKDRMTNDLSVAARRLPRRCTIVAGRVFGSTTSSAIGDRLGSATAVPLPPAARRIRHVDRHRERLQKRCESQSQTGRHRSTQLLIVLGRGGRTRGRAFANEIPRLGPARQ